MRYVQEFLRLKCAGDVLNVCSPLGNNTHKEITESMGMIKRIKGLFISNPMIYNLIDLCAGNALTSVLAVHLLPVKYAYAIDKRPRDRKWSNAKRFEYLTRNIFDSEIEKYIDDKSVVISIHACGDLSVKIIDLYKNSKAKALFLMPCCVGKMRHKYPTKMQEKLGDYMLWAWDLVQELENYALTEDGNILSPKNIIISSIRTHNELIKEDKNV